MIEPAEQLKVIKKVVEEQANDMGLWFIPEHITEDRLQKALRYLHSVIEEDPMQYFIYEGKGSE